MRIIRRKTEETNTIEDATPVSRSKRTRRSRARNDITRDKIIIYLFLIQQAAKTFGYSLRIDYVGYGVARFLFLYKVHKINEETSIASRVVRLFSHKPEELIREEPIHSTDFREHYSLPHLSEKLDHIRAYIMGEVTSDVDIRGKYSISDIISQFPVDIDSSYDSIPPLPPARHGLRDSHY